MMLMTMIVSLRLSDDEFDLSYTITDNNPTINNPTATNTY